MKLHAVGGSREGIIMPVTEYLERNAREYPDEVALVELNPDEKDTRRTTWKEFGLIEPTTYSPYSLQDSSRIEERLHGVYLTRKRTDSPTCLLAEESRRAIR